MFGIKEISKILALASLAFVVAGSSANATLKIDITQGHSEPLPVALTDFTSTSAELNEVGRNIVQVVSSDLANSGLFKTIDKNAFIEKITNGNSIPRFPDWRQINAQGLVTGTIQQESQGKLIVSFRLWDVISEQQVAGKEYTTQQANWRRIAHIISDEIYKRLTGEDGYFDSRVVYIAESGPAKTRVKRLAIMDQDGANHKFLTDGRNLVLTPRFSPNAQEIIYLSYAGNRPKVYIRNLQTGREGLLGEYPGMSFAPRFAPKGDKIAFSVANDGDTDIYVMDLRSRSSAKLTSDPSIDTSPSFSPDGANIVFNSDRGGSQQLYTMTASGGDVKRISFGSGKYGEPAWSPRGDWIAFTKISGGQFYIGVMRPDGSGERSLAQGYLVEGPTWSPNGRVIMFNKGERGTGARLYSVDLTGYNEREIVTPIDASDPSWSALLPM